MIVLKRERMIRPAQPGEIGNQNRGDRQGARLRSSSVRGWTPAEALLRAGSSSQVRQSNDLLEFLAFEVGPAVQIWRLHAQLRQDDHDLRPVFCGVIDRLRQQDRRGHLAGRTLPVDLKGVARLDLGCPLDQPGAGRSGAGDWPSGYDQTGW